MSIRFMLPNVTKMLLNMAKVTTDCNRGLLLNKAKMVKNNPACELQGLYSSPSIVRVIKARRMRWAGHVACMAEVRGAYNILVGRPEGRRPLGRPRRRWEDNIKMDLREIGFGNVDWIHWAQDRDKWRALVNTVMNLRVP
jgi:hypothetical protein